METNTTNRILRYVWDMLAVLAERHGLAITRQVLLDLMCIKLAQYAPFPEAGFESTVAQMYGKANIDEVMDAIV